MTLFRACVMAKKSVTRVLLREQGTDDVMQLNFTGVDPVDFKYNTKCYDCALREQAMAA